MAGSAGRAKRDREKARQEKQALKRERRLAGPQTAEDSDRQPRLPEDEVLSRLADLHRRFSDHEIGFDDFEAAKAELMSELET